MSSERTAHTCSAGEGTIIGQEPHPPHTHAIRAYRTGAAASKLATPQGQRETRRHKKLASGGGNRMTSSKKMTSRNKSLSTHAHVIRAYSTHDAPQEKKVTWRERYHKRSSRTVPPSTKREVPRAQETCLSGDRKLTRA